MRELSVLNIIMHILKSLYSFLNMCHLQESVDKSEGERYHQLMETIGWFFFDLLILGYVEDLATGKSFRIPGGLKWAIYIEVNTYISFYK